MRSGQSDAQRMTAANILLTGGIDRRSDQRVSLGLQRLCWSSFAYRYLIWSDLPLQGMRMLMPRILHGDTGCSFARERKLASDLTSLFLRTSHRMVVLGPSWKSSASAR